MAVWDKKSGQFECSATLEGHENEVKGVAWSPSGTETLNYSKFEIQWVSENRTPKHRIHPKIKLFVCSGIQMAT